MFTESWALLMTSSKSSAGAECLQSLIKKKLLLRCAENKMKAINQNLIRSQFISLLNIS
jgi:hypothetical protein